MRTTAGLHTQPGDTPTARLHPSGTYLEVNLAGDPAPDATLWINDPAFLAALIRELSNAQVGWSIKRHELGEAS